MSRRSTRAQRPATGQPNEVGDGLDAFLLRELPPAKTHQAAYLMAALQQAGERYDRYSARRTEWLDYANRRGRLQHITNLMNELSSRLCELDILSRDDLASRVDPKTIETLVGSLRFLSKETTALVKEAQEIGRPRDLAEEHWVLELADIYENAFGRPARMSGSGAGPAAGRGKFYRLLELSRPQSFPRHGKLSVRQVDRILKLRRKRSAEILRQMAESAKT
jgi:hypothetical protein